MDKEDARDLFKNADRMFKAGDFVASLELLNRLDREFPNERHIMYPRARCLAALGRTSEAMALCEQLIHVHGYGPASALKEFLEKKLEDAVDMQRHMLATGGGLSAVDLEHLQIDESPIGFGRRPSAGNE